MNKKGFAVSIILYSVILLVIVVLYILLGVLRTRYNVNEHLRDNVVNELNEDMYINYDGKGSILTCPECKFTFVRNTPMFTVWNTNNGGQTPTVLTEGLYDSYLELIASTGKNFFLGVNINEDNEVTNAYVCGIRYGTPFCLEGVAGNSKYAYNQALLQRENLYDNTCTDNTTHIECGPWDNSEELSADTFKTGDVHIGYTYSNHFCNVLADGTFGCTENE